MTGAEFLQLTTTDNADNDPKYFMVSVSWTVLPVSLFYCIFKKNPLHSCFSWTCFPPFRMNLRSTQKMGLLLDPDEAVIILFVFVIINIKK